MLYYNGPERKTRHTYILQKGTNHHVFYPITEKPENDRRQYHQTPDHVRPSLFVGNLFQQFYNTVDSIVVGNFVSKTALAAVGSTDCIINTIIGFFTGLSTGAGVVIAHSFGSGNDKALHRAVHTTIALTFVLSVIFTIAGLVLSPVFLQLMDTPEDVLPEASQYLRIYFAGVSGLMLYNMGSGILRGCG